MTSLLHVSHGPDFYEITVRDHTIVHIRKFIGDSQTPRDVDLDELSDDVRSTILCELFDHLQ
jgi:hypothetical protein